MDNKIIKTKLVDWKKLKPFQPDKLKNMSADQLNKIKLSFKNNGFKSPFYVWEENEDSLWCLDGHTRLPILKLLEEEGDIIPKMLPANFIQCKNRKEAKKAVLIYNSHYAGINADEMFEFVKDLDVDELLNEIDIAGIDFNFTPQDETISDDEVPDEVEPITKKGDLWELGRHRVLCGDSTLIEDVERLMNGNKADMVFTDPPYGMNLDVSNSNNTGKKDNWQSKKKNYKPVLGDNSDFKEELIKTIFDNYYYCSEIFVWGADYFAEIIPDRKDGSWLVWDKRKGVEDMKLTFSEFELCWSKKKHLREIIRITWSGLLGTEQEFDHKRHHPTQKPILLPLWFINKFTSEGDIIADLFLGSGSTLIASEKTNRVCYGMELDEHYCDVIVNRYINWRKDNDKEYAVKLNGNDYNAEIANG